MVNPLYAASHTLGKGAVHIELWLDYICPFSAKMFPVLYKDVIPAAEKKYPGRFSFSFAHQVQPWHPQGFVLHEAAVAVGLIAPDKFWAFSEALFRESRGFYDEAVVDASRPQLVARLADIASSVGVDAAALKDKLAIAPGEPKNAGSPVNGDVKAFIRVSRQNSINASPTVLVDGLTDNSISSSWTADQWADKLAQIDAPLKAANL